MLNLSKVASVLLSLRENVQAKKSPLNEGFSMVA
jgi:hypothetical protein